MLVVIDTVFQVLAGSAIGAAIVYFLYRVIRRIRRTPEQRRALHAERREQRRQKIQKEWTIYAKVLASPMFWVFWVTFLAWGLVDQGTGLNREPDGNQIRNIDFARITFALLAAGSAFVIRWWYRWLNENPRRRLVSIARNHPWYIIQGSLVALYAMYIFGAAIRRAPAIHQSESAIQVQQNHAHEPNQ